MRSLIRWIPANASRLTGLLLVPLLVLPVSVWHSHEAEHAHPAVAVETHSCAAHAEADGPETPALPEPPEHDESDCAICAILQSVAFGDVCAPVASFERFAEPDFSIVAHDDQPITFQIAANRQRGPPA